MAHSYTPGLKVLKKTVFKKERILPLKGDVLVKAGDSLNPDTIVASTNLPGNVQMLKVSNILNIDPKDVVEALKVKEGQSIKKGDLIAETSGIFGMFKSSVESPVDGTIESISQSTGRVVVREAPIPVEVDAYVKGVVDEVVENEGIVLSSNAAFIQGIFGIAGEKRGELALVSSSPSEELKADQITSDMKGKILIGGSFLSLEAYKKALSVNVAGIVVGGFNYYDLKAILGYNLGVAITGTEKLNTALIVTEGYGSIPMSEATYTLLKDNVGNAASINGATQIRAGVIRPEIVIPLENSNTDSDSESKMPEGIQEGSTVRVIRSPNFGKIGKVTSLPSELNKMESETMVRVAEINIEGSNFLIPRANLEMVEMDE
jgi:transcription antitermination factor NusG|tara:strand:- start:7892 stop:9019 length:1128 start_codon:yes stop_codon:yes gene_type:complete